MNRAPTTSRRNLFLVATLLVSFFPTISSCGGSSPTDPSDPDSSGTGTLRVMMVDAPTDEICELWVYIKDLRVKRDGLPAEILGNEDIGLVELLELQDGPPFLVGDFRVERDRYQFIEILLDEDQSYVIESDGDDVQSLRCPGERVPLQIPSEKFKVHGGPFEVTEATTVTIDFDAKRSLKRKGSQTHPKGWKLKPEVSIVEADQ